jgi:hypothetical protein
MRSSKLDIICLLGQPSFHMLQVQQFIIRNYCMSRCLLSVYNNNKYTIRLHVKQHMLHCMAYLKVKGVNVICFSLAFANGL